MPRSLSRQIWRTELANGYAVSTIYWIPQYFERGHLRGEKMPTSDFYETAIVDPRGDVNEIGVSNDRAEAKRHHARGVRLVRFKGGDHEPRRRLTADDKLTALLRKRR